MVDETEAGKGRATPSRKEAEAARKKQMKTPTSRKDQAKRDRAAREAVRAKQRDALKTGDERYLPAREQGPVRRFCRDYVDRRYNLAEYLLVVLIVVLLVSLATANNSDASQVVMTFVYPLILLATIIDEVIMVRGLKRELRTRFGEDALKGTTTYAVLRSTQLRRFRLPKPQVKRGQALDGIYG